MGQVGRQLGPLRREFAPAGRLTFFAGAKKVSKETPNTNLFERCWFKHLARLQRVVGFVATSIHGNVKDLFFHHRLPLATVIPAKAGMTNTELHTKREVMSSRDQPKTSPERQWLLTEPSLHVCTPEPNHQSPNRLVFRCFFGDFLCTSKESYPARSSTTEDTLQQRVLQTTASHQHPHCAGSRCNQRMASISAKSSGDKVVSQAVRLSRSCAWFVTPMMVLVTRQEW
jgi:hypothetical protein